MTENKRFDFEEEYITLDGGVFATAKNKHDAELISKIFNQLYEENKELKEFKKQVTDEIQDRYDLSNHKPVFLFIAKRLGLRLHE